MVDQKKYEEDKLETCGGWGAKIGAGHLSEMLSQLPKNHDDQLLVGYDSADDAAVYRISDDVAAIQTLDFFPPVVDDPYLFGQIAATNALSDVYAMGGRVATAMNIVGYPRNKSFADLEKIMQGGAEKVQEAGGVLAGGHSIHNDSVLYGLSVMGLVSPERILQNNQPQAGDVLFLTKKLGVGIITSAHNKGECSQTAFDEAVESMRTLNRYAAEVMEDFPISSCTDVTGFGFLGHLMEMVEANLTAKIDASAVPYIEEALECAKKGIRTGGAGRNLNHFGKDILIKAEDALLADILYDPQTSGGLLISLSQNKAKEFMASLEAAGVSAWQVGHFVERDSHAIIVE